MSKAGEFDSTEESSLTGVPLSAGGQSPAGGQSLADRPGEKQLEAEFASLTPGTFPSNTLQHLIGAMIASMNPSKNAFYIALSHRKFVCSF